jgi:ornithine cyclodeaminase/alanine dehydrogenase-like protein (mu-crystallin family)
MIMPQNTTELHERKMLFFTSDDILTMIRHVGINTFMDEAIRTIENHIKQTGTAYQRQGRVGFLTDSKNIIECMPSRDVDSHICFKIVNFHGSNSSCNLPSVMSTTVLVDEATGMNKVVADSTLLTYIRTGATTAIATKCLADNPCSFGFIGTGAQAQSCLHAFSRIFQIEQVYCWDKDRKAMEQFKKTMETLIKAPISLCPPKEFLTKVDVVTTTTYGDDIILKDEWVEKGKHLHINAIGGDTKGKQEIETALLQRATFVTDFYQQAIVEGELNVPITNGIMTGDHIFAELHEIMNSEKSLCQRPHDVVIFDSTGDPIEDLAILSLLTQYHTKYQIGQEIDFTFHPLHSKNPYEYFITEE